VSVENLDQWLTAVSHLSAVFPSCARLFSIWDPMFSVPVGFEHLDDPPKRMYAL